MAVGFALGWSSATLRDPEPKPVSASALPSGTGLTRAVLSAEKGTVAALSHDPSSLQVKDLSTDKPAALIGTLGEALNGAFRLGDYTDRMIRIREIVRTLSAEQLPGAYEIVKQLPRSERYQVLAELGKQWAEVDLKGALAVGLDGSGTVNNSFLSGVVGKWATSAPSEAAAWVNSLPPSGNRNSLVNAVVAAVGQNDPRAALQILKNQGVSGQATWAVQELFSKWATRDPQAAATAAAELKGSANYMALRGTARAWAEENPQAAMAWGEGMENAANRKYVLGSVVEQWADSDPLALIAWARNAKDDEIRRNAVSRGISQLAAKDLPAALSQIEALPGGEERDQAVMAAANSLGQQDARGAIQLLSQLEPGLERTRALSRMCEVWANSEPRAAVEWLFQNSPPSKDGYELTNVLGQWASTAPDEALSWAQGLPAGEKRDTAMAGVAVSLSYQEPARAQKLFDQLSLDAKASVAERFTMALVQHDPAKARAWAEGLPPGKAQAVAFGTVAYQMASKNVSEAAQWLDKLPVGSGRDRAVMGFSNFAGRRDPEGALAWALTISDERDRQQQVESLVRQWRGVDETGARKWLDSTTQLTSEQRRRIQER